MKLIHRYLRSGPGKTLAVIAALLSVGLAQAAGKVVQLDLEGPLGVATSEYIIAGIETANEQQAQLVIIRMDTPGGLVEPMRDIVRAILGSDVPVATYVSPGGARADSAGTYILLASHIAAMAPTTHLGAATPVSLGGDDAPSSFEPPKPGPGTRSEDADEDDAENDSALPVETAPAEESTGETVREPDTAMGRKVLNDAIAYIRGLAETHGRNADWAEQAVRDAATLTASQALDQNVIDLIADDRDALLEQVNGMELTVNNNAVVLDTSDVVVENIEPSWRLKFLGTIANPQVALLLMIVGIYGLMFEGWNPGAIVPGVVGVVCLLLAAYALQIIPVNYAGLALIFVGLVLIVAEAFAPSFGALGLGGIVAFAFGAIMTFDSGVPGFGISITFVLAITVTAGLLLLWMATYLVKLRRRGAVSGEEGILSGVAVAMEAFTGQGRVWLEGEAWQASSSVPIQKDQQLRVRAINGLELQVEPLDAASHKN